MTFFKYAYTFCICTLLSTVIFAQPVNDDCVGLIDLGVAPFCPDTVYYSNVDATESNIGNDNYPGTCNGGDIDFVGRDVWFMFTTNDTTTDYTITATGISDPMGSVPMLNPQVMLYRGDCQFDGLALLTCGKSANGQNQVQINVIGLDFNTPYFLRINEWSATAAENWGTFQLCIKELTGVIAAVSDDLICQGESVQLEATGSIAENYSWTPIQSLDNPSIANPIATPQTTTTYTVSAFSNAGPNQILNGDFEMGDTLFQSEYIVPTVPGPWGLLTDAGTYAVTSDPSAVHNNFASCTDHTSGTGNMMVVNGAITPNQDVWCQTLDILPFTDYMFSTWITSVVSSNPATLQFSVNGFLLGSPFQASSTTCEWEQFFQIWNSQNASTVTICIVNQNTFEGGNDFALDDISLRPITLSMDSVTVVVSEPQASISQQVNPTCDNNCGGSATVEVVGGTSPFIYQWNDPDSQTGQTATGLCAGDYEVTVTDNASCTTIAAVTLTDPGTFNLFFNVNGFCGTDQSINVTASPLTLELFPVADTYVQENDPDANFGAFEEMIVDPFWNGGELGYLMEYVSFLKFNLNSIPTGAVIESSRLTAYAYTGWAYGGDGNVYTKLVDDDGWQETTLTWNNQPTAQPNNLGSWWLWYNNNTAVNAGTFSTPELAAAVDQEWQNDETISFRLNSPGYRTHYRTKEFADQDVWPVLSIDYTCYEYSWHGPNGFASTEEDPDIFDPGLYCVTVTACNGCTAMDCIEVPETPSLSVSASAPLICEGESVNLNTQSNQTISYSWIPTTGLDDPTSSAPTASPSQTTTYTVNAAVLSGSNLVINGDFELGNQFFASDYSSSSTPPGNGMCQSCYIVYPSMPTQWAQCSDHTTGSGNQLIFNGSTTAGTNVWCQDINVVPDTDYNLSFWAQTLNANAGPKGDMQATINDVPLGSLPLGGMNCIWQEFTTIWNSGNETQITLCLEDLVTSGPGNDIAVDDISLIPICYLTDSVLVEVSTIEVVTLDSINPPCEEICTGSVGIEWTDGLNIFNNNYEDLCVGSSSFTITNSDGCSTDINVDLIAQYELNIDLNILSEANCNGENGSAQVSPVNGLEPFNYTWQNGELSSTAINLNTGQQSVIVVDANGCEAEMTFNINETAAISGVDVIIDATICNEANGSICADNVVGGVSPYTFILNNEESNDCFFDLAPGAYTLEISDTMECSFLFDFSIDGSSLPNVSIISSAGTEVCDGEPLMLSVDDGFASVLWSTGDTGNDISITQSGIYTVTITDNDGCINSDSIEIKDCNYWGIANVFTPDGDGLNDVFGPLAGGAVEILSFKIYNRWGKLVHNDIQPWDGTVNGAEHPSDVLIYIVELQPKGEEIVVLKGDVTLIR